MQFPPLINQPARVAERITTLDLMSDGRKFNVTEY
jgi:alkanesulfonate monooxygenase SsuD/methylene tetrahydromethanopterin reductase-like flavin-dependent oxidoreductase (luciferase family)